MAGVLDSSSSSPGLTLGHGTMYLFYSLGSYFTLKIPLKIPLMYM